MEISWLEWVRHLRLRPFRLQKNILKTAISIAIILVLIKGSYSEAKWATNFQIARNLKLVTTELIGFVVMACVIRGITFLNFDLTCAMWQFRHGVHLQNLYQNMIG